MRFGKQLANFTAIGVGLITLPVGLSLLVSGHASPLGLILLATFYAPITLGVTAGYHRLFTHRAYKAAPVVRYGLAMLGAAAIQGPVIEWVSDHRKHHVCADREGDPHSPHLTPRAGLIGAVTGFWHAHVGWLFQTQGEADPALFAPDLLADRGIVWIDRFNGVFVVTGLAAPAAVGLVIAGPQGALAGFFWGGLFRAALNHHMTFAVNSICHMAGARPFATKDRSRNLGVLALPTLGEAWHHNHHRYPACAHHGFHARQLDPTAWAIGLAEALGLVWDVNKPTAQMGRESILARTPSSPPGVSEL
jgi:stearoyl-CoA desaturase (delta-9 desaturase)